MFNNRRQSFDRYVQKLIMEHTGNKALVVAEYSKKKFPNANVAERISEDFNGVCFAETEQLALSCLPFAETVIIYRWDKVYPADTFFPEDGLEDFALSESFAFEGYSHETVTEETYVRA